jgi:hypothetical protein
MVELKNLIKSQRLLQKIWFQRQSCLEYDEESGKNIKTEG